MNMKKIKLSGIPGSLHLNKKNQYFAALYFDEPIFTIHDYETGKAKAEFEVKFLTPYTNIVASNDYYLAFLSDVYTITIIETKNFTILKEIELENAGLVRFIQFKENKLYVFTGLSRMRDKRFNRDTFIIDLNTFDVEDLYSEKIIINCTSVGNELLVIADNYNKKIGNTPLINLNNRTQTTSLINFNSKNSVDVNIVVDKIIFLKHFQGTQSIFAVFEVNNSPSKLIEIDHNLNIKEIDSASSIVGGYIGENQKILLTYDKKYYINDGIENKKLDFNVVTGAFDSNEEYFCFGADKFAVFVKI
ncbi:hypothetical protein [Acinetobacter sp. Marseille-Q1618]|uniref:hypothetical protein n=1 Tax=Acinetobacter sp. Marseille-Q1618 TaxID=2697502 RepID=UPI00156F74D6|nr:hypothetical protein [Acinetobacter sp. Marseille-Q1618]